MRVALNKAFEDGFNLTPNFSCLISVVVHFFTFSVRNIYLLDVLTEIHAYT